MNTVFWEFNFIVHSLTFRQPEMKKNKKFTL